MAASAMGMGMVWSASALVACAVHAVQQGGTKAGQAVQQGITQKRRFGALVLTEGLTAAVHAAQAERRVGSGVGDGVFAVRACRSGRGCRARRSPRPRASSRGPVWWRGRRGRAQLVGDNLVREEETTAVRGPVRQQATAEQEKGRPWACALTAGVGEVQAGGESVARRLDAASTPGVADAVAVSSRRGAKVAVRATQPGRRRGRADSPWCPGLAWRRARLHTAPVSRVARQRQGEQTGLWRRNNGGCWEMARAEKGNGYKGFMARVLGFRDGS